MPKATAREEDPYIIPEGVPLNLELQSVEYFSTPYTDKKGNPRTFEKWNWTFQIVGGEYSGLTVKGASEPKVTNLTEPTGSLALAKPWIEALLGREIALGEEVDTDDYIGLTAVGTVKHLEPRAKKEGDGFWYNVELDELFPLNPAARAAVGSGATPAVDPWNAAPVQDPWANAPTSYDKPPF